MHRSTHPFLKKFLLALALFLGVGTAQAQAPSTPLPIGINLRPITPFDRAWVFADAMKMASPWHYSTASQQPPLRRIGKNPGQIPDPDAVPLGPRGWPRPARGRSVESEIFVGMRGRFPPGRYVCTWAGGGDVQVVGSATLVKKTPNRLELNVDPWVGGTIKVIVSNYDPAQPTTDIRLWLPGLENSCSYFHPKLLEKLRPFSVLRFYPWMRIYTSTGRWESRETLQSARQTTTEGVAIEYMVDLCNELGADPWFCMPHVADDDYVRRFAELVKESLNRDARVYVEFSNEVWNTDYSAGIWARSEAQKRGVQATQVTAEHAARVFAIWREVFSERPERIVRVAGAHLHNPSVAQSLCRFLNGQFDAIAVGAYFSARADRDDVDMSSSASELMTAAVNNLNTLVLPRIADHKTLADAYSTQLKRHIALIAYEGGQSIVSRSPGGGLNLQATLDCQVMPEMYSAYRRLIDEGQKRGLELLVGYDFAGSRSSADTFSVLEYLEEPLDTAVKYKALTQDWLTRGQ